MKSDYYTERPKLPVWPRNGISIHNGNLVDEWGCSLTQCRCGRRIRPSWQACCSSCGVSGNHSPDCEERHDKQTRLLRLAPHCHPQTGLPVEEIHLSPEQEAALERAEAKSEKEFFRFAVGDKVRFVGKPEFGIGTVERPMCSSNKPVYNVRFDQGVITVRDEKEIEAAP